jgi:hypothetical protein
MPTIEHHTTSTDDQTMEAVMDLAQEYQEYRQSILGAEASNDQLQTLLADRIDAITRRDLTTALSLDDELEDAGMPPDYRITCYSCQHWAPDDHAHPWPPPDLLPRWNAIVDRMGRDPHGLASGLDHGTD